MAVFPQGLSNLDARCKGGERRVLHALKRCLEDDYIVWHDTPIGPRARQPDFVILSPRWGVLLLEVKSWKPSTLAAATRERVELHTARGIVAEANPLGQVREYMLELVDVMRIDPALTHGEGPFRGKLLFPYGCGVVFAGMGADDIADSEDFDAIFPSSRTMLREWLDDTVDPAAFQRQLWGMFTVHFPHTLSLPERDRIRWHLFPEVRMAPPQPSLFDDADGSNPALRLPDLMQVMDLQQEQVARTLGMGHRVIHGPAGSGKTMILIFRAEYLAAAARPDKPILVLCFNRPLAERIAAVLRSRGIDERVMVRTFHAWCEDMIRSYQLDAPRAPGGKRDSAYFAGLAASVGRAVEQGRVPGGQYTALLIDEAHDFEDSWLRMAVPMIDSATSSMLVLYDDAQSIYQKRRRGASTFASVGIEARGRTSILRLNYRNTAEILALAAACARQLLGDGKQTDEELIPTVAPTSAGRRGPMPVLIQANDENTEAELVADRIESLISQGVAHSEIALLARYWSIFQRFEAALNRRGIAVESLERGGTRGQAAESVKLITLHSAKGLEFGQVFVVGLQAIPRAGEALDDELRLLYVGMTRATKQLTLSARGESVVTQRVRDAITAVSQQFARSAA